MLEGEAEKKRETGKPQARRRGGGGGGGRGERTAPPVSEEQTEPPQNHHLDSVADVVQHVVVDGLPDVPDGALHVGRGDDLMGPQRALVGGQDADLPPGHLLFMDVHGLEEKELW